MKWLNFIGRIFYLKRAQGSQQAKRVNSILLWSGLLAAAYVCSENSVPDKTSPSAAVLVLPRSPLGGGIIHYLRGSCPVVDIKLSVQFSSSVGSHCLQLHGLQHAKLPCPWPTPKTCSNSCPPSWRSHPTISSSVVPFSSCLQSFPALGSFPVSQFFASGGQNIGASASAAVLPVNIQDWFPLGLTGWISLQTLKSLLQHHNFKASILWCSAFFMVQPSHPYMTTGKMVALTRQNFVNSFSAF